ncbi:MAG: YifB family Mg chelatase-like AAA ATPase [Akkermansiaceae bacterium]|nr:YifB family Mg chelatase-like AAA ATPase [Akkermansiaceae bacterium]
MTARLFSATVQGIDGVEVEVEVDVRPGEETRRFIVGLPDAAVRESLQRVESALTNSGFGSVPGTMLVNLAPADLKKQGPGFDLPIALGGLLAARAQTRARGKEAPQEPEADAASWCIVGELGLNGEVRPVRGILSLALEARGRGRRRLMAPRANADEAAAVDGVEVYPVGTLREAWQLLLSPESGMPHRRAVRSAPAEAGADFSEIKGQPFARRAMEIAAAGLHNLLMCGSPGSGKSMLARRLPTILPPLTPDEALEASKIHSICGLLPKGGGLLTERPFRAPHHTISDAGLMGGGSQITPGEVSLAHHGVLFLDELPEFRRQTLETLRQPLEAGEAAIARASGSVTFPCRFMLAAAMNPCPCGYRGDPRHACHCRPADVARYRRRISGPLLDRFDLLFEVPAVPAADLLENRPGESSAAIRGRVLEARARQEFRYRRERFSCNAQLSGRALRAHCPLDRAMTSLLLDAVESLSLSARAFDRILRVARTIADLAGRERPAEGDLYEAIQFRSFEVQLRL